MTDTAQVEIPPKLLPAFTGDYDFICAYGGRGSGKTRTFAMMSAIYAYQMAESGICGVILCAREYMNSLADSSLSEIKTAIQSKPWLDAYFEITENTIRTRNRRIQYLFTGLRLNIDSIKSKSRILLCWIDEAEPVSENAWAKLIPTVREEGIYPDGTPWRSQIWVTWNPEVEDSATDKRFRKNHDPRICTIELNYWDNPWFPAILENARLRDEAILDAATYAWIWEGAYLENSDRQVIKRYIVKSFSSSLWESAERLLFGADFGFAEDPSTLIRCFILKDMLGETLYIEHEAWGQHVELDEMHRFYDKVPGVRKWPIKGDSSRPETISMLKRAGFNIRGAKKWQGSVEDGIAHLNGFSQIIIHPRCVHTAKEARRYSYKVDKNGDILPIIVDKDNHCWDAVRYALDGYIKKQGRGIFSS